MGSSPAPVTSETGGAAFGPPPAPIAFLDGFYAPEHDGAHTFRWMRPNGRLEFEPSPLPRYLEASVLSEFRDLSQTLDVSAGPERATYFLVHGWSPISVPVPPHASAALLAANKRFPREYCGADTRTLAVRLRHVTLHSDAARHAAMQAQYANGVRNQREILDGRVVLESTPPSLGIDLHGACNVKPPCVYCEWDFSKRLEGDRAGVPFTSDTLREWSDFFDNAGTLINCSIGEPFMMRNLDELLEIFGRTGKALQMTTNGQILTERNIQKLVGLPVDLYVSLDAATAATYARLRNNSFDRLVLNLRRLVAAKGGRGALPHVHAVFMPMRCNLHELEPFVRLAADIGVDRLVLRPLNYSDSVTLDWERAGYRFEYSKELLPFDELVRASGRAARLCRQLGVTLADQMDFGGAMRELFQDDFDAIDAGGPPPGEAEPAADPVSSAPADITATPELGEVPNAPVVDVPEADARPALPSLGGEKMPACLEPWKSLYILRRGVLPCCYGGEPLAPMEEYRSVWNSKEIQAIRKALLRGRFHSYCLKSPACPIVRKMEQARRLPLHQRASLGFQHVWGPMNRQFRGWPNRYFYFPLKRTGLRIHRAATQPGYIGRHTRRVLGKLRRSAVN